MGEENQMSIPHLFRCPISLDLFIDPVTLSTGQTYDRPNIEKWLAGGNSTCPVTMQRLVDVSVIPNHTLRQYIDRWLLSGIDHHNSLHKLTTGAAVSGIPVSLDVLKTSLQSSNTPRAAKLKALRKVRILLTESDVGKSFLIQLGFSPVLVQLVFQYPKEASDLELVELGLDCILLLAPSTHLYSLNVLKQEAAFASLVHLLERGNVKTKTCLCILMEEIASSPTTQEVCVLFGQSRQVLQVLVSLLQQNEQAAEAAVGVIAGICVAAQTSRVDAIREGAVEGLVEYLSAGVRRNATSALAALEVLMREECGRTKALKGSQAVRVMVQWVFRVSAREIGSQYAVGALMAICSGSEKAREEAVAAGVVTQLLLLLQSQCGGVAKSRARAFLKLLRSSWVGENPVGNGHHGREKIITVGLDGV